MFLENYISTPRSEEEEQNKKQKTSKYGKDDLNDRVPGIHAGEVDVENG